MCLPWARGVSAVHSEGLRGDGRGSTAPPTTPVATSCYNFTE